MSQGGNHSLRPNTLRAYPIPNPKVRWSIFFAKMTAKDDPTISCSYLVAKTSVLAGREGLCRRGLRLHWQLLKQILIQNINSLNLSIYLDPNRANNRKDEGRDQLTGAPGPRGIEGSHRGNTSTNE